MAQQIQIRRDTAANFTAENPILAEGEQSYERDTKKTKMGDGVTAYNALPYSGAGAAANSPDAFLLARANHTGTQAAATISDFSAAADARIAAANKAPLSHVGAGGSSQHPDATTSVSGFMTAADKSKLDGVAAGATANATDAQLRDRSTHTGTQLSATVSDFATAADARIALQKAAANGLATLDGSGKVPTSQLPSAVLGGLSYQGTWDAATNSPALASGVGTKGYFYKVNVAGSTGLDGITDWKVGDWAVYNGATWDKVDNTDQVSSVAGKTGAVVLNTDDISEATKLFFTDVRAKTAAVVNSLAGSQTDQAPSVSATKASIATKLTDPMTANGDLITRVSGIAAPLPIGAEDFILRSVSGLPAWVKENLAQDIGGGGDGSVTLSGAFTAPDFVYYDTLTINAGTVFNPDAYIVYAKKLDLTNAPAGAIIRNGNPGANVSAAAGGAGGAAFTARVLATNGAGGAGAAGQANAGVQGGAGSAVTIGNGGNGGASGASGAGSTGAAAAAIAGGVVTTNVHFGRFEYAFLRGGTQVSGGAGGRGGNSGGGDGANSSRGAGGGGAGGAVLVLICGEIITGPSTPAGVIQCKGGLGGKQTNAPAAGNVGGASGGGGGGGGYCYIAYVERTGPVVTDLIDASGGNGGDGSPGLGTGIGGNGGQGGAGGRIQLFNITEGMGTQIIGAAGSNGTVGVGTVPGVGGAGGVCKATL